MLSSNKLVLDGAPNVVRDWLYVYDHVQGYIRAIGSNVTNEVFNISPKNGVTLEDTVKTIKNILNWKGEVIWGNNPRPTDPKYLVLDNAKAIKMLKFKPKYTLESGLKETIKYWKGL